MKVIINQNTKQNIKVEKIYCACNNCFSILEIRIYDVVRNEDRYGHWYSVQCQECGSSVGIPLVLAKRMAKCK